ncbi:hypothetical protein Q5752_005704 [Cryptotrichosporon argae]
MLPLRTRGATTALRLRPSPARAASTLAEAKRKWSGRLVVAPEVEDALETGRPVVALESAIITHGMPYPTNLTTAQSLEALIRPHAVPATLALHGGRIYVGAPADLLQTIADPATRGEAAKVSRRDLAAVLSKRWTGGTTVAGTMVIAHSVGVKTFVTGGIGGVHRGAEISMDVSADLIELGRTPMAVVCAGAKSILDIPRTLEVLETHGVCVATLGSSSFPAFYSPDSGCASPWTVDTVGAAAELAHTALGLPSPQATLLAVPIPAQHAAAGAAVQEAVERAVRESVDAGVDRRGKDVTPWLLRRVGELTAGTALDLNVKLIENNAVVGAQLARRLAELARDEADASRARCYPSAAVPSAPAHETPAVPPVGPSTDPPTKAMAATDRLAAPAVLVFGSAAIDLTSSTPLVLAPRTTTPGSVMLSPGGVGRNIAEAAQNLLPRGSVMLVSPVGQDPAWSTSATASFTSSSTPSSSSSTCPALPADSFTSEQCAAPPIPRTPDPTFDAFGKVLWAEMAAANMRTDGLITMPGATAVCSLTLERGGDLVGGVADMGIVERLSAEQVRTAIVTLDPQMVVFDLNLRPSTIRTILATAHARGRPTFADATSTPKLGRLVPALRAHPGALTHASPNVLELATLYEALLDPPAGAHAADGDGTDIDAAAEAEHAWAFLASLELGPEWRAALEAWHRPREWARTAGVVAQMTRCLYWCRSWWLKCGDRGVIHFALEERAAGPASRGEEAKVDGRLVFRTPKGDLRLTHYAAPEISADQIVSTTGAGDTLVGGLVAGLVTNGREEEAVARALERVGRTLRSRRAVG